MKRTHYGFVIACLCCVAAWLIYRAIAPSYTGDGTFRQNHPWGRYTIDFDPIQLTTSSPSITLRLDSLPRQRSRVIVLIPDYIADVRAYRDALASNIFEFDVLCDNQVVAFEYGTIQAGSKWTLSSGSETAFSPHNLTWTPMPGKEYTLRIVAPNLSRNTINTSQEPKTINLRIGIRGTSDL